MSGWRYYNHAMLPSAAPHELPELRPLKDGSVWKLSGGGTPLFARWTTDFDCGYETKWWYVIKDTPFDIGTLKAKRRYEINKGKKNFEVRIINPSEYSKELYEVQVAAFSAYPQSYRPVVNYDSFVQSVNDWYKQYETYAVNAALINEILYGLNDRLGKDFYICDGARSVFHETAFQDYLEKYFGFRKAYCNLHIKYRFPVGLIVGILYPFRSRISKLDSSIAKKISSVLKMEELAR